MLILKLMLFTQVVTLLRCCSRLDAVLLQEPAQAQEFPVGGGEAGGAFVAELSGKSFHDRRRARPGRVRVSRRGLQKPGRAGGVSLGRACPGGPCRSAVRPGWVRQQRNS